VEIVFVSGGERGDNAMCTHSFVLNHTGTRLFLAARNEERQYCDEDKNTNAPTRDHAGTSDAPLSDALLYQDRGEGTNGEEVSISIEKTSCAGAGRAVKQISAVPAGAGTVVCRVIGRLAAVIRSAGPSTFRL
jgi:hypothetical protein